MKRWLFLLVLSAAAGATQAQTLRCGNKLVTGGETRGEVVSKCGDPTEVDHSSVLRQPLIWIDGRPFQGNGLVEIPVEVWLYNLGPNKLMRRLRFEDGKLVAVETLGYGYIENTSNNY